MNKSNKCIFTVMRVISILTLIPLLLTSCLLERFSRLPLNSSVESNSNTPHMNEYRLSSKICQTAFGVDSATFYKTKGKDTLLERGYTSATLTTDDVLVLQLTDAQLEQWRNSDVYLQILQKILGEEKKIVSQINPPTDPVFGILYDGADTCGYEISDDYSKIVAGPGDDKSYKLVIPQACFMVQVLAGKASEEISVEYLEINEEGVITEHIFIPVYMYIFKNFDECKNLMSYEQIPSEIVEYVDAKIDTSHNGIEYKTFWGMKYQSENIEYEIFAYEFSGKDDALKYYINVTENDDLAEMIPLDDSDKNILGSKIIGEEKYHIIVIAGNKAYKLISSNLLIDKIDEMLSTVFSVKI